MSLYGNKFQILGANIPDLNNYRIGDVYKKATLIKNIDIVWANLDNSKVPSDALNLYKGGTFNNSDAQIIDDFAKDWQQMTVFYYSNNLQGSKLPVNEILNLFPHKYELGSFGYNSLFITADYTNYVMYIVLYSDGIKDCNSIWKDSGWVTGVGAPINILQKTNDEIISNSFSFIDDNNNFNVRTFSTGNTAPSGTKGYWFFKFLNSYVYNNEFASLFRGLIKDYVPKTDPFTEGGETGASGGGGTFGGGNTIFGGASDSIDIPPLPTASASAAGFITLFNPTLGQLNNLASYMWSDLFSLETFKKIFADPMDCILGLSIVPVKPASAGTSVVKIGNVSTDVSMNKTSSQYVAVDCGTIDVKEYWGAYLDYAPYTQCEIYLPYVGTKQISVDDVMNKAMHVVYHVDILSGACNAYVKCGDSVLYTFVGQCSSSIPISGNDWTNVLNGAISVAGKIGLAMATGGATALMSGLGAASSIISSSKPTVERSGAMSSTGGLLGIQKPYLILTRPKQALPENQNKYTGYPSFITMALSECSGYTEIDSIHLENMSCTDEEAQEIENLLKSGVIF